VGVSYTVDPKPRVPEALAELLVDPEAARARRQRADIVDDAPRAPPSFVVSPAWCGRRRR